MAIATVLARKHMPFEARALACESQPIELQSQYKTAPSDNRPIAVYVGMGSNIEPERNIFSAVRALQQRFSSLRCSSVYESPPVGFQGPDFWNLVVGFKTALKLPALAAALRDIEQQHGRQRGAQYAKFSSRSLDLDLLLYGDRIGTCANAKLPHDDILRYGFVLQPLAEIAGDVPHPEKRISLAALWSQFDASQPSQQIVKLDLQIPPAVMSAQSKFW